MILFSELTKKDVININNGCNLGNVCDLEIIIKEAKIKNIIIYGRKKCFGFLGREEDIVISWKDIEKIGEDTILVCIDKKIERPPRKNFFQNFFE